ncbi:Adhesion G protein-coupled receptor E3 [Bulinus truncatus]|nr:Adhesion G protein-coupled receptor E3 [Bulinus truncatus]
MFQMSFEAIWDKNMSLDDYQSILCPDVCFEEEKISLTGRTAMVERNFLMEHSYLTENISSTERSFFMETVSSIADNICSNIECFPCDCQKPRCLLYGICCPEVHRLSGKDGSSTYHFSGPSPSSRSDNTSLPANVERGRVKIGFYAQNKYTYLFISSCPDDYTDQNVKRFCEEDDLDEVPQYQLMDKVNKAVDPVSGITYFNRYCAECNSATEIVSWSSYTECDHYLHLYKAVDEIDFYKLSRHAGSSCNVTESPSWNVSNHLYFSTYHDWFGPVIDRCNVTGRWSAYDPDVESACFKMSGFVYTVRKDQLRYSNVFCAICNSEAYPNFKTSCESKVGNQPYQGDPPFTVLLNFHGLILASNIDMQKVQTCSTNEWTGPSGLCYPTQCADGKLLKDNICKTALSEIRGLGYMSKLLYGFNQLPHENVQNVLNIFTSGLTFWFLGNAKETFFKFNLTYINDETLASERIHPDFDYNAFIFIEAYFIADRQLARDVFEDIVTDTLFNENITLVTGDDLVKLDYIPDPLFRSSNFDCSLTSVQCWSSENIYIPSNIDKMWALKSDFLSLNDLLTCPYVRFNKSDVILNTAPNVDEIAGYTVTVSIDGTELKFSERTELMSLSVKDQSVDICVETLTKKLEQRRESKSEYNNVFISLYVITVLCLSVSMLCLVVTVISYACFQKLRSTAGIHNMFLSSSLLLAQCLLLAISHLKPPGRICTVLAVFTHYTWLCMFAWTFICCFHMYTVFTAKNRTTHNSIDSRSQLIKRIAFSLLVPAVIVVMVVVADYSVSDGKRMGYGHKTCFLNSVELTSISLATPLSVVLLSNTFFFISSVLEIYKIKRLQMTETFKSTDRSELYIYIKLSTVTGVFWVLALLGEGLNNDPLRYLSAVMNGLQGFFIFLSYVCNRRVLVLYKVLLFRNKEKQSSEKGTLSKLASEIQEKVDTKEEKI